MGQSASKKAAKLRDAARRGDTEQARRLHAKGANLEAANSFGQTPLFITADNGHEATVRALAELGANARTMASWPFIAATKSGVNPRADGWSSGAASSARRASRPV